MASFGTWLTHSLPQSWCLLLSRVSGRLGFLLPGALEPDPTGTIDPMLDLELADEPDDSEELACELALAGGDPPNDANFSMIQQYFYLIDNVHAGELYLHSHGKVMWESNTGKKTPWHGSWACSQDIRMGSKSS